MNMLDYINETKDVLERILSNKTESFLETLELLETKVDQIYLLGSGTSCHAGIAVKKFLEDILEIRVTPMFPNEFLDLEKPLNKNVIVVGISQSGGSQSTANALAYASVNGMKTLAIVGEKNTLLETVTPHTIYMDCGKEVAVAKTKGYSACVFTLMILGLELAKQYQSITDSEYKSYYAELIETVNNIPNVITASTKWADTIVDKLTDKKFLYVLGYENQLGTIKEGVLKLLETVRVAVSGYDIEEFMHGIYNSMKEDSVLIYIVNKSKYHERAVKLSNYLMNTTKHQYSIGKDVEANNRNLKFDFIDNHYFSVIEYIIPFQVLAYKLSTAKGIDPSKPSDANFHAAMGSKVLNK